MAKRNAGKFVVDLGGINLKPVDERGVNAAIQGAVLAYLARNQPVPLEQVRLLGNGIKGMFVPKPKPRRRR